MPAFPDSHGDGGYDTLRDLYGYDNSPFLDFLRSKGFYVADKSVTNYPRTELSVASSLNMKYMNYLSKQMPPDSPVRDCQQTNTSKKKAVTRGEHSHTLRS